MNTLAAQQQALLDALFAGPQPPHTERVLPFRGIRGLTAYRNHAQAQASRSLGTSFPVLAQLLGDDNLTGLAGAFWHAHPPQTGDLAQWGGALPDFLSELPQLAEEPYLADVARVEWALHQASTAADTHFHPESFQLLAANPPDSLHMMLASGVRLIHSRFPVASIVCAHGDGAPALEQAAGLLRAGVAETALVWRQGMRPRVAECGKGAANFLQTTLDGGSLAQALDRAPGFAFDQWLAQAVQSGLVLGVARVVA